jgi:hypothetical protein
VDDGERGYWFSGRNPAAYDYSNAPAITVVMADLYAQYVDVRQLSADEAVTTTLSKAMAGRSLDGPMYFMVSDSILGSRLIDNWKAKQPPSVRVFHVSELREASLLLASLRGMGFTGDLQELTVYKLLVEIKYQLCNSPLDAYLRAAAGIVTFENGPLGPAIVRLPSGKAGTVSQGRGLTTRRAVSRDKPYVLLDSEHWLIALLVKLPRLPEADSRLIAYLREIVDLLVLQVALGGSNGVKTEAVHAINGLLTAMYEYLVDSDSGIEVPIELDRRLTSLEDLVGKDPWR